MGAGIPPELIGVVLLAFLAWQGALGIGHGVKVLGHKTKCGIVRLVGHRCAPEKPKPDPAQPDNGKDVESGVSQELR